jgi:ABC-2 type transport system ATP-binding protein
VGYCKDNRRVARDSAKDEGAYAAAGMAPVVVCGLTKRFGPVTAVDHLDFSLEAASTVALLGGNGAGKTTTIAMLLGLIRPSAGAVRIFGTDISECRYAVAQRMNFQSPYVDLPQRLTVRQNLMVYAGLYGIANASDRIAGVAAQLQIESLLSRPTGKLSAGQKTRVGLAKALLNAPEILLLDEPTASLDPDTADWVRQTIKDYASSRGATLLIASHNMSEVERLADRVILLQAGRIVEDETPAALVAAYGRETLEDVFLDVVRGRATPEASAQRMSEVP